MKRGDVQLRLALRRIVAAWRNADIPPAITDSGRCEQHGVHHHCSKLSSPSRWGCFLNSETMFALYAMTVTEHIACVGRDNRLIALAIRMNNLRYAGSSIVCSI